MWNLTFVYSFRQVFQIIQKMYFYKLIVERRISEPDTWYSKLDFPFQYSAISWAKDHRVHHKFTDTDADPYNIKRGFFFAQLGWILYESHPEFKKKLKTIDISDLMADPLLVFQDKYYYFVMPLITFVLPTLIPIVLWNETFLNAFCVNVLQFICTVHTTGFINSVAHLWGSKPYDR